MNQHEHDELVQFEDQMWRARHAPISGGEFAIYLVGALIWITFCLYVPMSCYFGWWPW